MTLRASQIQDASEYAAAGLPDADIAILLACNIQELQEPFIQRELLMARTRTIAQLAKSAVKSAIDSNDAAEIRQVLRLFNRTLGDDDAPRRAAPVMVQPGSVAAAMQKQKKLLENHKFDPFVPD